MSTTPSPLESARDFAERAKSVVTKPDVSRWKPMPGQKLFLDCQARYRAVTGGNRSGKSAVSFADDVLVAIRRHPTRQHLYADRPLNLRVVGVDFDRGIDQVAIPYFKQYVPPAFLVNGSWEDSYQKGTHMLTLLDGTTVSFMSYEQDADKFQGVALDHIHFDEEPPAAIWKESMVRLLDHNGTWTLSQTPVTQSEWIEDTIISPARDRPYPQGTVAVFDLQSEDNIHLSQEAMTNISAGMTEDEKRVRFHGEYTGGDRVFPTFTGREPFVISHAVFLERLRANPEHWVIFRSMDHGTRNPTSWTWTAVHPNGSVVSFRTQYAAGVTIDAWVKRIKKVDQEIGQLLGHGRENSWKPYATFGDPAIRQMNQAVTMSSIQREYAIRGVPIAVNGIVAARTGSQSVGLTKMNGLLEVSPHRYSEATGLMGAPQWQITDNPENSPAISELRRARVPKQSLTAKENSNPKEQIRDKDNHWIDSFKYLILAVPDLAAVARSQVAGDMPQRAEVVSAMGATGYPLPPDRGGRVDAGSFSTFRQSSGGNPDQGEYLEA